VQARISTEEHRERQRRTREAAAERGLDVVVAFSRGGGTHDRIADVLWLAGLATSQPFVPDAAGHWRAAGHVAVVLPVDMPATAVVDAAELQTAPVADSVVVADDPIAAAALAVADGLSSRGPGRVGVFGSDALPAAWWAALDGLIRGRRPNAALEPADELGLALRRVKSPAEQRLLRAAGRLGADAMGTALDAAVPGAREAEVAAGLFEHVVRDGGASTTSSCPPARPRERSGLPGAPPGRRGGRPGSWPAATCCASMPTAPSPATSLTSPARRLWATLRPPSRRS
jgi:Xaa-Pro dipeptidase